MAAHLARIAGGRANIVILVLLVPVPHGQRHVHALVRDGKQVLSAPPALFVVAPHALLSVGLGEGGQRVVPPLQGRKGVETGEVSVVKLGWGVLKPQETRDGLAAPRLSSP